MAILLCGFIPGYTNCPANVVIQEHDIPGSFIRCEDDLKRIFLKIIIEFTNKSRKVGIERRGGAYRHSGCDHSYP